MLLSILVMMLTKDTGPSEIPGHQAGANKDTSEWPEARIPVTSNTMPGFHTCKVYCFCHLQILIDDSSWCLLSSQ